MKHCKDCEPSQQIHWIAYWSVVIGWVNDILFNIMEFFFKRLGKAISKRISIPFFKLMVFLKLGHLAGKPDEHDTGRTKCFWEEAEKRGIKMREFHLGPIRDVFMAEFKGRTITFDGLPRSSIGESDSILWMGNKGILKTKLQKTGLPIADGGTAWNKNQALKIFNRVRKPVITKPSVGSRSRHTTIHITTPEGLVAAFKVANQLSPVVVVEEELIGPLFRGTLVAGKLVGVVKRDQPLVVGDGIHTLRELWKLENDRPERKGPVYHEITFDHEAEVELERQKINMDDIPEKGRIVSFSQKTSRGCGGTITEVTDITHPENKKMLEELAAFLKDPLIGADFIMEDITRSWREQPHSGIIECNSLPFIDLHHYPLFGKPNNIAAKVWDVAMPESKLN